MTRKIPALLIPLGLAIASPAGAQDAPTPPNVQTAEVAPAAPPPTASSDPRGITTADTGSSIDKPATVDAMPQTGYHAPVIGKRAEPLPHTRMREGAQVGIAPAATERRAGPDRRRASPRKHRARRRG